jgi:hypothetical protein
MLKFFYCGFITLLVLPASTAVSATTLILKSSSPGFVMRESALYTTCTLDDKGLLVIKNQLNGLTAQKRTILQVGIKNIKNSIAEASGGIIKKPDTIEADRPSTTYYAYQKQRSGKLDSILLWEDNGVPTENTYNESPAALRLRNFMDALCK